MEKILAIFAVLGVLSHASPVTGDSVVISDGKKVKLDYTLKVDGQVVETSVGGEPLEYTHGEGKIIPGLTKALAGMKAGDEKSVVIQPEDAYGQVNEEAFRDIPLSSFSADLKPEKGMIIEMKGPNEEILPAVIWEIGQESVKLNFNHPLAGKTLEFQIKVLDVQ